MVKTTRKQREALKRVFDRMPLGTDMRPVLHIEEHFGAKRISYRTFRKSIAPSFDGSGCIMVQWCGMWLGIETDGHTHS